MKILILGASGMLGSMVTDYLSTKNLDLTTPSRQELDKVNYGSYDFIINCIGIIKQKLTDPKEAIKMNSLFPYIIAEKAPKSKIIHISTDCVFSGHVGNYLETSEHDATEIYGKTKSLGEVQAKNYYIIRTSVVGPSRKDKVSLFEWFLSQKKNATVNGYINHFWNGVTTLHFAKLCYALIKTRKRIHHLFHFIPRDIVNKAELLRIFSEKFNRRDIIINKVMTPVGINRSLGTNYPDFVSLLWKSMGYNVPPSIEQMIDELAKYIKQRNFYGL